MNYDASIGVILPWFLTHRNKTQNKQKKQKIIRKLANSRKQFRK